MANPQINQGTLNRVRGSVTFADNASLNVTAPYLGQDAISIAFNNDISQPITTMTGVVQSLQVVQMVTVTMHLLRTQSLSDSYKKVIEDNAIVGDITIRPDSSTLSPYTFVNCAITSVENLTFAGQDAGFVVNITGAYLINGALFDIV